MLIGLCPQKHNIASAQHPLLWTNKIIRWMTLGSLCRLPGNWPSGPVALPPPGQGTACSPTFHMVSRHYQHSSANSPDRGSLCRLFSPVCEAAPWSPEKNAEKQTEVSTWSTGQSVSCGALTPDLNLGTMTAWGGGVPCLWLNFCL